MHGETTTAYDIYDYRDGNRLGETEFTLSQHNQFIAMIDNQGLLTVGDLLDIEGLNVLWRTAVKPNDKLTVFLEP